jgi:hypothetical protein
MRQIVLGAWLLIAGTVFSAACGGERFSSEQDTGAGAQGSQNSYRAGNAGSTETRSTGGESNDETTGPSGGSKSASAGSANQAGQASQAGGGNASGGMAGGTSTGGTNGFAANGGTDGETCPEGTITFRMLPGPNLSHDYLCDAGCGTGWLTITDPDGLTAFSVFAACGTASCDTCALEPCAAAACLPKPLTGEGVNVDWSGTYMAKDSCGQKAMACQKPACVKPGKYKAKACAAINGGTTSEGACMPKDAQLCAVTEFEFPATTTVELVLK